MNQEESTLSTLRATISLAEYRTLRSTPRRWEPILAEIAASHALGRPVVRAIEDGSNLIAFLGDDLVIKLFPPFLRHQHESERRALQHLRGQLGIPIPEIVIDGETSGWPYLIMRRLEGVPLGALWGTLSGAEKRAILHAVGGLIAEVQAIPPGPLSTLAPRWSEFVAGQVERCRSRHERLGLPQHLLAQIEPYLERTRHALPDDFPPAVLTGEYTPGNILMRRHAGTFRIAGLIDFGDVMVGFGEYDLLGPSTFLAAGDAAQVRALLRGFGHAGADAARGLRERLMRMLLLHRYSDLGVQVSIEGWQEKVRTLDELAHLLWPLGEGDGAVPGA